jgi:hypothetical protein
MRFDVLSRMCKAIGCFNVRTHPLFEGLNSGERVWLCVLCMFPIDMWPTGFQVCRLSCFCECSRSTSKQARYHSPVWTVAVRDPCPGIHCFLRQEVCGDLFILCKGTPLTLQPFPPSLSAKGRCVVECPDNHLFVEAPAVMGASYIWYPSHIRDAACSARRNFRVQEPVQNILSAAHAD